MELFITCISQTVLTTQCFCKDEVTVLLQATNYEALQIRLSKLFCLITLPLTRYTVAWLKKIFNWLTNYSMGFSAGYSD